jgi:hypothetical protein
VEFTFLFNQKYLNAAKDITNSAESDIIKTESQKLLQSKIDDGSITLQLNKDTQKRHMEATKEDGRSYFVIEQDELQDIINNKHGTGVLHVSKAGQIKETITCDKDVSMDVLPDGSAESSTNRFTIHYSKTRTHAVPSRRRGENE